MLGKPRSRAWRLAGGALAVFLAACTTTPPPPTTAPGSTAPGATGQTGAAASPAAKTSTDTKAAASPAAAGQPAAGTPVKGGTMVEVAFADIKTMNSVALNDVPSGIVADKLFEPMVWTDAKTGAPIPWLAESWDISPDATKYVFRLRKGVNWSDGKPLTAHDVKFTFESVLDPKIETTNKSFFSSIVGARDKMDGKTPDTSGIKVVDDYTLEVTLSAPDCSFIINGGGFLVMPKHALEGQDLNTAAFNSAPTVTSGPFKFKEWAKGSNVTLVRNDSYWGGPDGGAKGGPNVDQYVYKVVADQTAVLNNLRTGEADFGEIQPAGLEQARQLPGVDLKKWTGLRYTYAGFNLRRPIFQDKAVRKALAMSLDTKTFIEKVLLGEGDPLASHMPPTSWAYNANVPMVKFDQAAAKKMLDDAGWKVGPDGIRAKDGQKLKFTLWTNAGNKLREAAATIAQQQWKEIGVDVEIQFEEFSALVDRLTKTLDFDMVIIGWSLDVDPNPESVFHSKAIASPGKPGNNFGAYSNPEVDKLIEEGKAVAGCAQADRKKSYDKFQEILAEDQPYIWLFLQRSLNPFRQRVQGEDPTPFRVRSQASWNADRMWLTP